MAVDPLRATNVDRRLPGAEPPRTGWQAYRRDGGAPPLQFDHDDVKIEEFTENGQLVVRAELPGIDPDRDVDISTADGNLCIRAERRHEENERGRDYRRSQFRYGAFSRVAPLPPNAKESDIKATHRDGVLEVRAPMEEHSTKASKNPMSTADPAASGPSPEVRRGFRRRRSR